jgi:uncharacterized protein DUF4242
MPRYMVERTFPEGLNIPPGEPLAETVRSVMDINAKSAVTWVHSCVSDDKKKSFCVYDGPDAGAIHHTASQNGLPVDRIREVTVLNPYFFR